MILYTNGASHTAAAEAVNLFSFAEDERSREALKRAPHPANLKVSWGAVLSGMLKTTFYTDAESACGNTRIIRTTKEWIERTNDIIPPEDVRMIIQWAKWEDGPEQAYKEIIEFHKYLNELGYKHNFFNGNDTFMSIPENDRYDFDGSYLDPYLPEGSFDGYLQSYGFNTVITSNTHYGPDAHAAWANHLFSRIREHNLI